MSDRKVPDFDDLMEAVNKISGLTKSSQLLDIAIKAKEAEIVKTASTDAKYFQNGKAPSMEYVKSTWKYTGFENELLPLRIKLAELEADLENSKLTFQALRDAISLYITISANERKSAL